MSSRSSSGKDVTENPKKNTHSRFCIIHVQEQYMAMKSCFIHIYSKWNMILPDHLKKKIVMGNICVVIVFIDALTITIYGETISNISVG